MQVANSTSESRGVVEKVSKAEIACSAEETSPLAGLMAVVNGKAQAFLTATADRAATLLLLEEHIVLADCHLVAGPEGYSSTDSPLIGPCARPAYVAGGSSNEVSFRNRAASSMPSTDTPNDWVILWRQRAGVVRIGDGTLDPSMLTGGIPMFWRPELLHVLITAHAACSSGAQVAFGNLTGRSMAED